MLFNVGAGPVHLVGPWSHQPHRGELRGPGRFYSGQAGRLLALQWHSVYCLHFKTISM
jgi:hypothetical protein